MLDDSSSLLFEDGFVATRKPGRTDIYLFAYGWDYLDALRDFHILSGKPPLLPRWALGNWFSRWYSYTQEEYIVLMDRFKAEGIPLTAAVADMDW